MVQIQTSPPYLKQTLMINNIYKMETIDQTLKDLVIKEATALRQHATKEELANLDFKTFDGSKRSSCIYGQMTGYCFSNRAHALIDACCERVYSASDSPRGGPKDSELNGAPDNNRKTAFEVKYWSPIEVFVDGRIKEQVKPLIDFLKGETETLEL